MALLMDTPYLEQLKLSSARLQDMIPSTNPFAMYTRGSETAPPMIQGVPQNFFDPVTGQFMMPNLQLRSGEEIPVIGSTMGSTPNFGTYTPAAFGEAYQQANPVTPAPSLLDTSPREGRRGRDSNERIVNQFVGDRLFRVSPSGVVSSIDPNSLDYKLNRIANTAMSYAPSNLIRSLLGEEQKVDPRIQEFMERRRESRFEDDNTGKRDASAIGGTGGRRPGGGVRFGGDRRTGDASRAGGTGGRRGGAGPN
jgi:hypothetical protein